MVPWGVPGGPLGVPRSPDALFSEFQGGSLGVPYTNLVQFSSVQLFKTSLGLEREEYYRQPVLNQDLPGRPMEIPKGPLEAPFSLDP